MTREILFGPLNRVLSFDIFSTFTTISRFTIYFLRLIYDFRLAISVLPDYEAAVPLADGREGFDRAAVAGRGPGVRPHHTEPVQVRPADRRVPAVEGVRYRQYTVYTAGHRAGESEGGGVATRAAHDTPAVTDGE